jgi:hypothetical protein
MAPRQARSRSKKLKQENGQENSLASEIVTALEVNQLRERVKEREERVEVLETPLLGDEQVVMLRTLTREEAKKEIRELFQTGETLFYSDIATRLGLDLKLVVDICDELVEEGEVGIDADYRDE